MMLMLAWVPLIGTGCWSFDRARTDGAHMALGETPTTIPDDRWPARDIEVVRPFFEATPREVFGYRIREGVDSSTLSAAEKSSICNPEYSVVYKGLHGRGLLRIFDEHTDAITSVVRRIFERYPEEVVFGFKPNARMISSRTVSGAKLAQERYERLRIPDDDVPSPSRAGAARPTNIEPVSTASDIWLTAGKPLRIPPPREGGTPWRGLILHFHASASNPYEPRVMDEFRRRGWAVVDLATETSIETPIPEKWASEIRTLRIEAQSLRNKIDEDLRARLGDLGEADFSEVVRLQKQHPRYRKYAELRSRASKLEVGSFQACPGMDLDALGAQIALAVDDALAGGAYSAESVLGYVKSQRPDLQGIPIVVIGFSAGALAAPTAVARVRDQIDAVVLIGGGCDLFMLSQGSVFIDGGIRIRCGEEKVSKETLDRIDDAYLRASRLDPYYTAPLLRGIPVLQVHATSDDWVPYKGGEILYERLGRPDRLSIAGGHQMLFYFLPGQAKKIADWVESAVPRP
jgi:hypothetical protein